jgi:hypothetical protein
LDGCGARLVFPALAGMNRAIYGSDRTIRGRQGGRSHCIKRRSPYGPIRDLGELFIELGGSEAINEYFEHRRHSRCGHKIQHGHSGCRARPKN